MIILTDIRVFYICRKKNWERKIVDSLWALRPPPFIDHISSWGHWLFSLASPFIKHVPVNSWKKILNMAKKSRKTLFNICVFALFGYENPHFGVLSPGENHHFCAKNPHIPVKVTTETTVLSSDRWSGHYLNVVIICKQKNIWVLFELCAQKL